MRYLKTFEEKSQKEITLYELLKGITNGDLEPSKIKQAFDLDRAESIDDWDDDFDDDVLTIEINEKDITYYMDVAEYTLGHLDNITSNYSGAYDFYVDEDEYNYFQNYFKEDSINKFRNLCRWLGYGELNDKKEPTSKYGRSDEGMINEPANEYGFRDELLEDIRWQLASIHEGELRRKVEKEIDNESPISIDYIYSHYSNNNKKDRELTFDYEDTIKFLEKYNCKEINTLEELLEKIGNELYNIDELETDLSSYENQKEYDNLDNMFDNNLNDLWDDEIKVPENKLISLLIKNDSIEPLKKHFDDIMWDNKYKDGPYYDADEKYLPEFAVKGTKCFKWFTSEEFEEKIKDMDDDFVKAVDLMVVKDESEDLGLL